MQIMPFMFGVYFILLALRGVIFGEMKGVIDLFRSTLLTSAPS